MPAWPPVACSGWCRVFRLQSRATCGACRNDTPPSRARVRLLLRVQITDNLKGASQPPRAGAARAHGVKLPSAPGAVAQLGERHVRIVEVRGSIPLRSTTGLQRAAVFRGPFLFLSWSFLHCPRRLAHWTSRMENAPAAPTLSPCGRGTASRSEAGPAPVGAPPGRELSDPIAKQIKSSRPGGRSCREDEAQALRVDSWTLPVDSGTRPVDSRSPPARFRNPAGQPAPRRSKLAR